MKNRLSLFPLILLSFVVGCAPLSTPDLATPPASVTALTMNLVQLETSHAPKTRAFLNIRDQNGQPLTDFRIGNFSVVVRGAPRPSLEVGVVTDPLRAVLVLDRSGSMNDAAASVNAAATTFIDGLGPTDMAAIIDFSDTVNQRIDFTNDKNALKSVINSSTSNGATALYDALIEGAKILEDSESRKLLILLTDGEDNASKKTVEEAIRAVNDTGLSAYVIGLGTSLDANTLSNIATSTSGTFTQLSTVSQSQLVTIFTSLLQSFTNLYYVRYLERGRGTVDAYLNYGSLTAKASKTF